MWRVKDPSSWIKAQSGPTPCLWSHPSPRIPWPGSQHAGPWSRPLLYSLLKLRCQNFQHVIFLQGHKTRQGGQPWTWWTVRLSSQIEGATWGIWAPLSFSAPTSRFKDCPAFFRFFSIWRIMVKCTDWRLLGTLEAGGGYHPLSRTQVPISIATPLGPHSFLTNRY